MHKYTDEEAASVCYETVRAIRKIELTGPVMLLPWEMLSVVSREEFTDEVRRIRNGADSQALGDTERKAIRGLIVSLTF